MKINNVKIVEDIPKIDPDLEQARRELQIEEYHKERNLEKRKEALLKQVREDLLADLQIDITDEMKTFGIESEVQKLCIQYSEQRSLLKALHDDPEDYVQKPYWES